MSSAGVPLRLEAETQMCLVINTVRLWELGTESKNRSERSEG